MRKKPCRGYAASASGAVQIAPKVSVWYLDQVGGTVTPGSGNRVGIAPGHDSWRTPLDYRTATRDEGVADFIATATALHKGRYDYTHVERQYVNGDTKVTIVCPDHGPFELTPREHRRVRETKYGTQRGQGCRGCNGFNANVDIRRDRFIAKAVAVHGARYDYGQVTYVDARTDVTVTCGEHGAFTVRPDNHTSKYATGCPNCALRGHRAAPRSKKVTAKGQWRDRPASTTTGRKRMKPKKKRA